MLVPFSSLPNCSRVWIYPSNRIFSKEDKQVISDTLSRFLNQWTAHGANLKASFILPYDHFIVIALDESGQHATGCSIDASVHTIQTLEKELDIQLLDKMNVCYRLKSKAIAYQPLKEFRKQAKTPAINSKTIVFNNLVVDKGEFETFWEVPASESWHARFIK